MRGWIRKHPILFLFFIGTTVPAGLNYSGFCIREGRWLSNEEKIYLVISRTVLHQPDVTYNYPGGYRTNNPATRYADFYDFTEKNKGCCVMDISSAKDGGYPSFWDRIFDRYSDIVNITYSPVYVDSKGENPSQTAHEINNCGLPRYY